MATLTFCKSSGGSSAELEVKKVRTKKLFEMIERLDWIKYVTCIEFGNTTTTVYMEGLEEDKVLKIAKREGLMRLVSTNLMLVRLRCEEIKTTFRIDV